ncbi:MAG: hypothetical protein H7X89_06640 [Rhizobiales bacterium]|nr:hypothetical protein [Hyphomicrobiales bacterium]
MKILLTILCCLMILFSGGCLVVSSGGPSELAFFSLAVLGLNLAIIATMYGWTGTHNYAFYILGTIDIIIAGTVPLLAWWFGLLDKTTTWWVVAIAGSFGLKGLLSFLVPRRL